MRDTFFCIKDVDEADNGSFTIISDEDKPRLGCPRDPGRRGSPLHGLEEVDEELICLVFDGFNGLKVLRLRSTNPV